MGCVAILSFGLKCIYGSKCCGKLSLPTGDGILLTIANCETRWDENTVEVVKKCKYMYVYYHCS